MRTRRPTPADLPALAALLSTNECLCILGRAQAQPEWVTIGKAYVSNALRTEYASFENCMARYESPASRLWVLVDESDSVLGSVGVIEDPQHSTHFELVRMYVNAEHRQRGYGRLLLDELFGHARAHGATQLSLTTPSVNAPGLGFYRSVGFSKVRAFSITDSFGDDQGKQHTLELTEMRMDLAATEAVAVT
jgi:ribosomal protein S18 acetylase RimI-like enzyme|tara:strand:- start:242 stop:817 length:576 start_codon:yes stop_codon:yes gene_type:complete